MRVSRPAHTVLAAALLVAAGCTSIQADAPSEAGGSSASGCQTHAECDDAIGCTVDTCLAGSCVNPPGAGCPPPAYCQPGVGCVETPGGCTTAQECVAAWETDPCRANIQCDTSTGACTFELADADGDGHAPLACGGGDCDDANPQRFPENPEVCDGIDNDCNAATGDGCSCPAGQIECGGQCRDPLTDPHNCGACGRDCGTTTCQAGNCAPVQVATGTSIEDVAVDATHLYFGETTNVRRCPKSGCVGEGEILISNVLASEVRVRADRVYYLHTGMLEDVSWIPTTGGSATAVTLTADYPHGLALDAAMGVYWADYDGVSGTQGQVYLTSELVADIEADSSYVYFSVPLTGASFSPLPGNVFRCPLSGCQSTPQLLAADQVAGSLAVDANNAYWAACSSTEYPCAGAVEIRTCPIAGCASTPIVLAAGLGHVYELVADETHLYWTQNTYGVADGAVLRCALTGCGTAPDVLSSAQPSPGGIALDSEFVYWVTGANPNESGPGSILRVRK